MRKIRWVGVFLIGLALMACGGGVTYPVSLRYQPLGKYPRFEQKFGSTLAVPPFQDERKETFYIGYHRPLRGSSSHFKSDPFPLERAVQEALPHLLSKQGVRLIPISSWDGTPESLKDMEADSVLMVRIKEFWSQGIATTVGTRIKTSIRLTLQLGVKQEKRVYSRNVEMEKEVTVSRSTPERVGEIINQMLTDLLDSYFSNPY